MCLVALAWKSHPRWRLFMAGNRDEFHARPTAALDRWPPPHGDVVAGREGRRCAHLQSMKYWIMLNCLARPLIAHIHESTAIPLAT